MEVGTRKGSFEIIGAIIWAMGLSSTQKTWMNLYARLSKKLKYWTFFHLLVGKHLVVNSILSSSLWLFFSLWVGSKKAIKKCKSMPNNFLWGRGEHHTPTRVNCSMIIVHNGKWEDWVLLT